MPYSSSFFVIDDIGPLTISRSIKKPYVKIGNPEYKRFAVKALRTNNTNACNRKPKAECANGKSYRKHYNSWNICDWSFYSKNPKARRK